VEVVASRNQTKFDGATEIGPLMRTPRSRI